MRQKKRDALIKKAVAMAVERTAATLGMPAPQLQFSQSVATAQAHFEPAGRDRFGQETFRPTITVNARWLIAQLRECVDKQCLLAILYGIVAHESAHLYLGIASGNGPISWLQELEADLIAGWVLRQRKINAVAMEWAYLAISPCLSRRHPAWPDRVMALRQGHQWGNESLEWAMAILADDLRLRALFPEQPCLERAFTW